MLKKLRLSILVLALGPQTVLAQSAIVRGEVSAGNYENVKTDGAQALKVSISGTSSQPTATFTSTAPAVTNASSTILAANTSRKYLVIQNNDTAGNIFIEFTGAATTAKLKLSPGQSYSPKVITTQAVTAIGDIANNPNVVVIEGQ